MDKIIYAFWTEDNELTARRKTNLEILKSKCGTELKFLNYNEIPNYELPDHKFHKAYKYLSATHKSDYLRTYFMHFYGGGYCDIKRAEWDWNEQFDFLNQSDYWITGYRLRGITDLAVSPADINSNLIRDNWNLILGYGAMICKPNTPFTKYWFDLMTDILDKKIDQLKENPAMHVRDRTGWRGTNSNYPLSWAEIGPEIFMKSCYTYKDKLCYQLPCPHLDEKYR